MGVIEYQGALHHMEWADARLWESVLATRRLDQDERARELLHHFHSTQWAYLQAFEGRAIEIPELQGFPDLRSIGRWARRFYQDLRAFRDALDEPRLAGLVTFPWAAQVAERLGSAGPATVADCLLQLALHSAHHRGQVAARLREAGGEPPLLDFIAWVWLFRPAPGWGSLDEV